LVALTDLFRGEVSDALASIIKELTTSKDKPEDIIDRQVACAVAGHASRLNQACRAVIAALDAGVPMGKDTKSSQEALANFREDKARFIRYMALLRKKQALPNQQPKPTDEASQEKKDLDPTWSWSVERLARWIEGPVIEVKQNKSINRADILMREKAARAQVPKTKSAKKEEVHVVTNDEVGAVIQEALSATARFFLDEINDLLPLANSLKASAELGSTCEKMKGGLEALATKLGVFNEDNARAELTQAEAAIEALRKGLKTAKISASVQQNFAVQLSAALKTEPMSLGKRHGGAIACQVSLDDWSYVANTFHNCWVPHITSVAVGDQTMQLDDDQAVALYVTGSSLSGYAFDVSVHLWRRRSKRKNLPSDESSLFPAMNETAWFDTYVPCCVLHVPRAT
jgi:hypothetical protein